jgi:protein-tyrosine phosphatase
VIDLHCHVLAGIDDGPNEIEASVALGRVAEASGIDTIVATPHVSWRYGNDSATIGRLVEQTNDAFAAAGLMLTVLPGAEIAITRARDLGREELSALALGGGPWLLLECPFTPILVGVESLVFALQEQGHRIVLAHPERCPGFQRDPSMLDSLVAGGALTSITAGSLVGRFGQSVRRFALELIEAELVHNVASDAHDATHRRPGIADELERAGLAPLGQWLTEQVPGAILSGEHAMPLRPRVTIGRDRGPQGWWRRRPFRRAS